MPPVRKALDDSVGKGGKNAPTDVAIVLGLLALRKRQSYYAGKLASLNLPNPGDPDVVAKTTTAIETFQRIVMDAKAPDGNVGPSGTTIFFIGGVRKSGKQIVVDLADQKLYAYEGSSLAYEFDATSGDSDHATALKPTLFTITRKEETYRSKKYDAQMNYALFFSADGKAIHQSNAVGVTSFLKAFGVNYFGSHGCVRLTENDARTTFRWATSGTPVFIDMCRDGLE